MNHLGSQLNEQLVCKNNGNNIHEMRKRRKVVMERGGKGHIVGHGNLIHKKDNITLALTYQMGLQE